MYLYKCNAIIFKYIYIFLNRAHFLSRYTLYIKLTYYQDGQYLYSNNFNQIQQHFTKQ